MSVQTSKDLQFVVPDEWRDRSVTAFSPPATNNLPAPSWVITREKLPETETLRTFSSRQLTQLAKGLRDFSLKENRDVVVDGVAGSQLEFSWLTPNGRIIQRLTLVERGGEIVLFTSTAPMSKAKEARDIFDQLLQSVRWMGMGAPPPPFSVPPPPMSSIAPAPLGSREDWLPGSKRR